MVVSRISPLSAVSCSGAASACSMGAISGKIWLSVSAMAGCAGASVAITRSGIGAAVGAGVSRTTTTFFIRLSPSRSAARSPKRSAAPLTVSRYSAIVAQPMIASFFAACMSSPSSPGSFFLFIYKGMNRQRQIACPLKKSLHHGIIIQNKTERSQQMMRLEYRPRGVCSQRIEIDVEDGCVQDVKFTGGCSGNLQGISRLVKGMPVEEVISRVEGIRCGFKPTSCPDQLAQALKQFRDAPQD